MSFGLAASIDDYFPHKVEPSASNYGQTGLFETPSAKFMEEGSLRLTFSASYPNEYTTLTATPFSWMEASFRYSEVKNRLYGPRSFSGNQSWKDKSFDIKLRLFKENYFLPDVALGLRDIAGTGIFSSEYIVATKSIGEFHVTAGIGWGVLGTDANIKNPMLSFDSKYQQRPSQFGLGGDFNYKDWFRGNAALFGGFEYDLKKYGLRITAEYDTSNPDVVSFIPMKVDSRINIGLKYYLSESLNLGFSFDRGSQFRIYFALKGGFSKDTLPKPRPKNVIPLSKEQKTKSFNDKSLFYRSLNKSLQDEIIYIQGANYHSDSVDVAIATSKFSSFTRTAGRTARIVSALSVDEVKDINIFSMNGDLEVAHFKINKKNFDLATKKKSSTSELLINTKVRSPNKKPLYTSAEFQPRVNFPEFTWKMSPALKHQIGGPEGFYLGQLWWKTDTTIKFKRSLSLYTSFGINIYDTFKNLNNPSDSTLPHVRSDVQDYLTEGKNNIQRMQLEYIFSPYKDWFVRADFGILEEMFGGFGGEIFYRPFDRNISFGLSAHRVKQRDYDQRFSFRDYVTNTGHLAIYYDFPDGITSQVAMGKYLAGDKGVTLDLGKRFGSGFAIGVFATKTDVSKEEFGEGSFDKGFYFSIPTSLFYSDYRTGSISFGMHPLTKDGGSFLNQHNSLFSILGDSNRNNIMKDWKDILD